MTSLNSSKGLLPRHLKAVLFVAILAVLSKGIYQRLWPWGHAVPLSNENRPKYSSVDFTNDSLQGKRTYWTTPIACILACVNVIVSKTEFQFKNNADRKLKKIYERLQEGQQPLMKGPETVVFGNDGTLYVLTEDGFLVSLTDFEDGNDNMTIMASSKLVAYLGIGRPLGGKFNADNTLYIADAHLGLARLKNPGSESKVELIASRVFDEGKWTKINYANDVAIGPKTGMVYFTDCKVRKNRVHECNFYDFPTPHDTLSPVT